MCHVCALWGAGSHVPLVHIYVAYGTWLRLFIFLGQCLCLCLIYNHSGSIYVDEFCARPAAPPTTAVWGHVPVHLSQILRHACWKGNEKMQIHLGSATTMIIITLLRVIPTLPFQVIYSDIYFDILPNILFDIYSDTLIWHIFQHFIWYILWRSI